MRSSLCIGGEHSLRIPRNRHQCVGRNDLTDNQGGAGLREARVPRLICHNH